MTRIFLFIFTLLFHLSSYAQEMGSITGKATDSNNLSIEFANVFISAKSDSAKIVSGTITDSTGSFVLTNLPLGEYVIHFQFIGFVTQKHTVFLNTENKAFQFDTIILETDVTALNSVEVTAFRNLIQKTEEGIMVRTSENITQIGGTAADLLKNMPGVLVGAEGEITLRGKSPLILINDYAKPKCAYQQEQQMMQDDSIKQITPLALEKENLLQQLTLLSTPFQNRIELMNQKIADALINFGEEYRKKTDKHSAQFGHVSTPEYERVIENLQIKRQKKISLLKENIKKINEELSSDSEIQNKSQEIELLESKIDSSWNSIIGEHQPIIDSLQQELNTLNRNYKNTLSELSQEKRKSFEMTRDSIGNNPCNHVRK